MLLERVVNTRRWAEPRQDDALLRPRSPGEVVSVRLVGRNEAAAYAEAVLTDARRADYSIKQEVYALLGLIPADADLLQLKLGLEREARRAFYVPELTEIYLVDEVSIESSEADSALLQELVHAVQDWHHDLDALRRALDPGDWDGELALSALIDGDARWTELYLSSGMAPAMACDRAGFEITDPAPPVIERELSLGITEGACFVDSAATAGPHSAEALFLNPPTTTEQILHPEAYERGETASPPMLRTLSPWLSPPWTLEAHGNLGEFTIQNYLGLGISDFQLVRGAAAGWGGDAWNLYENGSDTLLHLGIRWDTPEEASEFWVALVRAVLGRAPDAEVTLGLTPAMTWNYGSRRHHAGLAGDEVTLVVSTSEEASDRAAEGLLLP